MGPDLGIRFEGIIRKNFFMAWVGTFVAIGLYQCVVS